MTTREALVSVEEKPALAAMLRDYIREMATVIAGVDPAQPYDGFDLYWTAAESHWPFWLKVGNVNAGFALLDRQGETMQVAEFFVTPGFRRQGVGQVAARRLIARYPGPWQITQREANSGGIAFWHRVLGGFIEYEETTTRSDAIRRQQRFRFPERQAG